MKRLYFLIPLIVPAMIACFGFVNGLKLDNIYRTVQMPFISSSASLKAELGPEHLTMFGRGSWHSISGGGKSVWVKYDYRQPVLVKEIILQAQQQNPDREPKVAVLFGSDDDVNYRSIAEFSDIKFGRDDMWASPLPSTGPHRFYKLEILKNNGNLELTTLRYFWLDVSREEGSGISSYFLALKNPILLLLTSIAYAISISMFFRPTRERLVRLCSFHATPSLKLVSLDMWRGLAALSVATMHIVFWGSPLFDIALLPDSFLQIAASAVPFFVVLSGYLITMILRKIQSISQIQSYFVRRILRIYPLYVFVLMCLVAATWPNSLASHERTPLAFFLGNLMMFPAFGLRLDHFIIPHVWSLFVEVFFYLVMPVIVFTGGRKLLLVSILLYLAFSLSEANFIDPTFNRDFSIWKFFFIGTIIFEIGNRWRAPIREWVANLCVCIGLIFLFFHASRDIGTDFYKALNFPPYSEIQNYFLLYSHYDQFVAISTFFLILGSIYSQAITKIADSAPFKVLGAISYSVFLIHPFFFRLFIGSVSTTGVDASAVHIPMLVLFGVLMPALLALSLLTFLFVERPFLILRLSAKR